MIEAGASRVKREQTIEMFRLDKTLILEASANLVRSVEKPGHSTAVQASLDCFGLTRQPCIIS